MVSIETLKKMPVTIGLAVIAICASFVFWANGTLPDFIAGSDVLHRPWSLVLAIFPHVNPMHIIFNLLWLFQFGKLLEPRFGSVNFTWMVLLMAAISSAGEFALLSGGIGLSGVVYGMMAMLWVLGGRDFKLYQNRLSPTTIYIFVGWFFLCIAMTYTGVQPVANIAHGLGAAAGALIAMAVRIPRKNRAAWIGATTALLILTVSGALFFRKQVNLLRYDAIINRFSAVNLAAEASAAMERNDLPEAARLYEIVVQNGNAPPEWQYNLGVVYEKQNRYEDAAAVYRIVADMKGVKREFTVQAARVLSNAAIEAMNKNENEKALAWAKKAVEEKEVPGQSWYVLGVAYERLNRIADAKYAYSEAALAEPENHKFVEAKYRLLK